MDEKSLMDLLNQNKNQLESVIACNEYTRRFGLSLTKDEAEILLKDRKEALKEEQRVEFGEGILTKLIYTFCDSAYLYQDNYVDTIERLQEIFYRYKNEAMDELSDDELLECMKHSFEGECQGSLDYLEETALDRFAREIRRSTKHFMGRAQEDELNPVLLQADGYEVDEDDESF